MRKMICLLAMVALLLTYNVVTLAETNQTGPAITRERAIELMVSEFMQTAQVTREWVLDNFDIAAGYYVYENGQNIWQVDFDYLPVEDTLCQYTAEIDANTGEVFCTGPAMFMEMISVYDEYEKFSDYSAYYVAIYADHYGLPSNLWDYRQMAA